MSAPITELPRCGQCSKRFQPVIRKMAGDKPIFYATCAPCREYQKMRQLEYRSGGVYNEKNELRNRIISSLLNCHDLYTLHRVEAVLNGERLHLQSPNQSPRSLGA